MPSLSGTEFSENHVNDRSQSQVPSTQDLPFPVPQIRVHPPQEQVYGINHFEGIESKRIGQNVPNTIKKNCQSGTSQNSSNNETETNQPTVSLSSSNNETETYQPTIGHSSTNEIETCRHSVGHSTTNEIETCHPIIGHSLTNEIETCHPIIGHSLTNEIETCHPIIGHSLTNELETSHPIIGHSLTNELETSHPITGHSLTNEIETCHPIIGQSLTNELETCHPIIGHSLTNEIERRQSVIGHNFTNEIDTHHCSVISPNSQTSVKNCSQNKVKGHSSPSKIEKIHQPNTEGHSSPHKVDTDDLCLQNETACLRPGTEGHYNNGTTEKCCKSSPLGYSIQNKIEICCQHDALLGSSNKTSDYCQPEPAGHRIQNTLEIHCQPGTLSYTSANKNASTCQTYTMANTKQNEGHSKQNEQQTCKINDKHENETEKQYIYVDCDQQNKIISQDDFGNNFFSSSEIEMTNKTDSHCYTNGQNHDKISPDRNGNEGNCHAKQELVTDTVQYVNQACYYVHGKINQTRLNFLIDSGSSICVLSEKVFEKISTDSTILQETARKVRTANGGLLKIKGACTLKVQLDHLDFDQEFIIANIEEPGILGISFLDQSEVDIKIRKKILKTKKGKLKLYKQGTDICCRVQLCESVTIPPHSETFLKTYTSQNCCAHLNLVEPTHKHIQRGLLVGKTLVDTSQDQMTVSVVNASSKSVKLKENITLGTIHPIEQISICDLGSEKSKDMAAEKELPTHLKSLVENASSDLTETEKKKLSNLVFEFQDVFMSPDGQLKQTHLAEHYIDTGDTKPFKMPCRRIPMFKKPVVEAEIKKMLDQNVIEPSNSAWNSPICLVAKRSGEWRFCVDLRKLNSVTRLDTFPLPNMSETLDRLANSSYYSTLDMVSGYWQLSLNPHDR